MSPNIIGYVSLAIIFLAITPTTSISIAQLNLQHADAIAMRQIKSAEIRKYFNESVDPCEDFYEFTCGKFAEYYPTDSSNNIFDILEKAMLHKIKKVLIIKYPYETDSLDNKMKDFYRSCMYVTPRLLDLYRAKLKDIITEFGQMPVLEGDTWQQSDFDWQNTLAKMIYKTGLSNTLFNIDVKTDLYDNTVNRVFISEPSFKLEATSLYVDEALIVLREKYKNRISLNLQAFLGVKEELAKTTAQQIFDFESSLARGMRDGKHYMPITKIYTLISIEELQKKYLPIWDTRKMISEAMGFIPNEVVVQSPYLDHVFQEMRNAAPKAVANYIFYNYISRYVVQGHDDFGKKQNFCIEKTQKLLYKPLMNSVYRKFFTEEIKEGVVFMWNEIKSSFEKALLSSPRLQWMTADTRQYAVKKLKAMKLQILSFEHTNFSKIYNEVDLIINEYAHNMNELLAFEVKKARESFNESAEPLVVPMVSPDVVVTENTVKIPIDVLQPFYFWYSSYPNAYNFAAVGFYVAHEILHNFDNTGRSFGISGNALDWWDSESDKEFVERSKCFVDQYKSHSYAGRHLLQMQSEGEYIADNGGLRLAYEAYLSWYERQKDEKEISESELFPDLDYNNRQLFFISYSHLYCSTVHPDNKIAPVAGHIHVPDKFRIISSLSNFEEFSKEFNCSLGSLMNRVEKCEMY